MYSNLCIVASTFLLVFVLGVYGQGCVDNSTNCASMKNNGFCNSTFYNETTKTQYCAQTCGLCDGSSTTASSATSASTVSSVSTTGSSGTCVDSSTNCASMKNNGFCNSTFYDEATKTQYCAQTCGLCSGSGTTDSSASSSVASTVSSVSTTGSSGTCVDTATACSSWVKNGFCTSTFYTDDVKKANCAKSCNLCT